MDKKNMTQQLGELFQLIHQYEDLGMENKEQGLLTPSELHIVECIGFSERMTSKEIGETLNITKGAVSQQLKKLIGQDIVIKQVNKNDKRISYLILTQKGLAFYEEHQEMKADFAKSLIVSLTKEEREGFIKGVRELNQHLKTRINSRGKHEK